MTKHLGTFRAIRTMAVLLALGRMMSSEDAVMKAVILIMDSKRIEA